MNRHIHLIGIGGIGMSAVAQLLIRQGWRVSGCDLKDSVLLSQLRQDNIPVYIGHHPQHLDTVDTVAYSSAIPEDNPEMQEARHRGIRLMKRAEILNLLMQDKTVISVTGMHGKTTTASLAAYLLSEAGLFPTVAVGGILQNLGGNALMGQGEFFVAEADESDGSFLCYHPDYSIITNIDYEHLDYYRDFSFLQEAFRLFINQTKQGGAIFCWRDDPYLTNLLKDYKNRMVLFGLQPGADVYASSITFRGLISEFDCYLDQRLIGHFQLSLGGKHNILNALAVIALGLELGIDKELIKAALVSYRGTRRRLEIKFRSQEILVLDDYGHHPTEIKATLEAVKSLNPRRLLVIFQPHRYTRTKLLLDSFASCFDLADGVIITDIYSAGEPAIPGVSGYSIYERLKARPKQFNQLVFLPKENILDHVLKILNPQDIILVLGAGDITKISDELAEILKRQAQEKGVFSKTH
ncbi:MAG: UDP-N-acetylmuramate--L-alanine ligase [Candidatus Omnitrophota bacterium]|jgi:UDP-N-acetylmuramate--alanine ligase